MIRAPKGLLALENEVFEIQRCRAGEIVGLSLSGHARVENPNHLLDADTALLACPRAALRRAEGVRMRLEWQRSELTDVTAKAVIYEAFVEGKPEAPKHLARIVHDLYFEPKYEEFKPRTIWSLSNRR
jgi:hypothetical protein